MDCEYIELNIEEFAKLPTYQTTHPSEFRVGMRWKRKFVVEDSNGHAIADWVMGEYIPGSAPNSVSIQWQTIKIKRAEHGRT
jgi:hypothetical protein